MVAHLIVFGVAALVTIVTTPLAGRVAWALGAVDQPTARKVHLEPTPRLGGLALLAGFLASLGVARLLPALEPAFSSTAELVGVVFGVLVIVAVGLVDDTRGLEPPVKLAGQILAAIGPLLFGVQLIYAWVPGLEVVALSADLGFPLTILAMVAMINAVNLIDGLDGLAAGIVGIAAIAFFVFTMAAESAGIAEAAPSVAPVIASALAGMCLGFLVHNFHPAKIFMGDAGSMMLGLLLASAGVSYVGRTTAPNYADFAGSIPLLIPVLILAVPFVDTAFAIVRRLVKRQPLATADKGHLHHLLITFGHSHRRAVLTMYFWSAFLAFVTVGFALIDTVLFVSIGAPLLLLGVAGTVTGMRRSRSEDVATVGRLPERRSS
ncbi:MAG TPA: MraY family glycosyltransferase [Nitriliruptorales bacterium]